MVKVVEARKIFVNKRLYNTCRSFLESSEKECYEWNVGVYIRDEVAPEDREVKVIRELVEFEKPERWTLKIVREWEVRPPAIEGAVEERMVLEADCPSVTVDRGSKKVTISDIETDIEIPLDTIELKRTFIISDVPFMWPIRLADVVEKMHDYLDAAREPPAE
jgi:hypothetical protein